MKDNIYYTDMFDEDIKNEEYLEEANVTGLPKYIRNMFGHILKFIYQPERQSRGWVITIGRSIDEIRDVFAKDPSKINEVTDKYLDDRFVEGLKLL